MSAITASALPAHVVSSFDHLVAQGQEPRHEDMYDGCYVVSASHRGRPGRFCIYYAPGGSWTHDANRARQLAERFPQPQPTRRAGAFYCRHCGTDEAMPGHEC